MSTCCSPQRRVPPAAQRDRNTITGSVSTLEALAALAPDHLHMVGLAGGTFLMGSEADDAYPDDHEGPGRRALADHLAIGPTPVTNAEFAAYVLEAGHV